jgi:Icc-related predicted phosphoesterase
MKILHLSDSHCHALPTIPEGIELLIHSGDCSNSRNPAINANEVLDFIEQYKNIPIKYKIYVAGNHDTSIEKRLVIKQNFTDAGIIYLENESVEIEGFKIWGSPFTPMFCDWSFMKARNTINRLWDTIPDDSDIIIVHGPCKGILDLAYDPKGTLEFCGDNALKKRILKIEPLLFLSGHIHNNEDIINAGYTKLSNYRTIFSNGSIVTDGKFGMLTSLGNIFNINKI